jgi:quercetin dioxygenase-like cupin family protein
MDQISFQNEQSRSWVNVDPGVDRMIMGYDKSLMMVKVRFQKDAIGAMHSHGHIQSTYIASGRFEVTIDGNTRLLSAGDTFFVESNLVHGVVCKEKGTLIDVFHPCREDFL